jgi:hypothetical protein
MGNSLKIRNIGKNNRLRNAFLGLALLASTALGACKKKTIVEVKAPKPSAAKCVPTDRLPECSSDILFSGMLKIGESLSSSDSSFSVKCDNIFSNFWGQGSGAKVSVRNSCGEKLMSPVFVKSGESVSVILGKDANGNPMVKMVFFKGAEPSISVGTKDQRVDITLNEVRMGQINNTMIDLSVRAPCKK